MPITVPLNNNSLLVDAASESLNNFNIYYYYENAPENVASLQLNSCKVLREFTYTNIITGNGLFTFNVPEKIPGIFALQLLKCYVDVQPRLQELTETIRVNGQYPLSAFITELDETDGISKDSVINVDVSGDVPVLESKSITINSNGSQNVLPSSGYDGLSSVTVNVSVPQPVEQIYKSISVTENGEHYIYPDTGYDVLGAARAIVNVPNGTETKTITSNGTYTPTSPNIGFSSVTVNVPQENLNIENSKMVNISTNGLKNVLPSSGYDALSKVQVNVAVPNETETKTITSNGTYTPTSPNIGFSSVTVNVPELNIESNKTLTTITTNGDSVVTPSNGYDAMQKVTFSVNVPNGTEIKTITNNGTYTPTSPNIGFSSVTVNVPEKKLESRQVYYSTNGIHRLSPSTGYDGFTYADIEVAVPTVEKLNFNKFRIYYYTPGNQNENNKYVNPITMSIATQYNVDVTSGQSIFYITPIVDNVYKISFYNNNSGSTLGIGLGNTLNTMYLISTGQFISRISLYNDNELVLSDALRAVNHTGSNKYMLDYEVCTDLPSSVYQFNSS